MSWPSGRLAEIGLPFAAITLARHTSAEALPNLGRLAVLILRLAASPEFRDGPPTTRQIAPWIPCSHYTQQPATQLRGRLLANGPA